MLGVRIDRGLALFASRGAVRAALLGCVVLGATAPQPAFAQFNFFQPSEPSPRDIYDVIVDHGFRMAGPLMRNGNVYVADVIGRGQRRERLVISARSGQILQRFLVDVATPTRRGPYAREEFASRTVRPEDGDNFFSRLTRGWNDDAPPRPPLGIDRGTPDEAVAPRIPTRKAARPKPSDMEPRLATRRDEAPITSAPLPAPSPVQTLVPNNPPQPAATVSAPPAAPASAPASTASVPSATSGRPTVVTTDPLRIPGEKPKETTKPAAETAAVAPVAKPASSSNKPVVKPAPADVPVAPLD